MFIDVFDVFFFQAEDGIRDLVRSRGLGDVYKRQEEDVIYYDRERTTGKIRFTLKCNLPAEDRDDARTVSYTHLTLPTSDLV